MDRYWHDWRYWVGLAVIALGLSGGVRWLDHLLPRTPCASEGTVRTETLQTVQGAMVHQVVERPVCFDAEDAR